MERKVSTEIKELISHIQVTRDHISQLTGKRSSSSQSLTGGSAQPEGIFIEDVKSSRSRSSSSVKSSSGLPELESASRESEKLEESPEKQEITSSQPTVKGEEAEQLFPGFKEVKPYLRYVPDPSKK